MRACCSKGHPSCWPYICAKHNSFLFSVPFDINTHTHTHTHTHRSRPTYLFFRIVRATLSIQSWHLDPQKLCVHCTGYYVRHNYTGRCTLTVQEIERLLKLFHTHCTDHSTSTAQATYHSASTAQAAAHPLYTHFTSILCITVLTFHVSTVRHHRAGFGVHAERMWYGKI